MFDSNYWDILMSQLVVFSIWNKPKILLFLSLHRGAWKEWNYMPNAYHVYISKGGCPEAYYNLLNISGEKA